MAAAPPTRSSSVSPNSRSVRPTRCRHRRAIFALSRHEAEQDRSADCEDEEAPHTVVEELDAAADVGRFLGDDFRVVVGLIGEQVYRVVGCEHLHRVLEVFDAQGGDGAEEEW